MGLFKKPKPKTEAELEAINKANSEKAANLKSRERVVTSAGYDASVSEGDTIRLSADGKSFTTGPDPHDRYTYNESTGDWRNFGRSSGIRNISLSKAESPKKEETKKSSGGGGGGGKKKKKYNQDPTAGNTGNSELDERTNDLQNTIDQQKADLSKLMLLMAELAKPIQARSPEINAITEDVSATATTDTESSVLTNTYVPPTEKKKKSYLTPIAVG